MHNEANLTDEMHYFVMYQKIRWAARKAMMKKIHKQYNGEEDV